MIIFSVKSNKKPQQAGHKLVGFGGKCEKNAIFPFNLTFSKVYTIEDLWKMRG